MRALILLLSASCAVAAPAPFAKPERRGLRTDLDRLQGVWALVPNEDRAGVTLSVEGSKFTLTLDRRRAERYAVTLDPTSSPRKIDLIERVGGKDELIQGIYRFQGDMLVLRFGHAGRPTDFAAADGSRENATQHTFRRKSR